MGSLGKFKFLIRAVPFLVLLFAGFRALSLEPGELELRLVLVESGREILALPMEPGEPFVIRYFHSVENSPIWETHSLDARGRIFIEEEKYLKFGAGMGKMPRVGRMVRRGIYEVIEDMHMPVGRFVLRVGSGSVDHTLIWRGRSFPLSQEYTHEAVQFSGAPVGWIHRFFHSRVPVL